MDPHAPCDLRQGSLGPVIYNSSAVQCRLDGGFILGQFGSSPAWYAASPHFGVNLKQAAIVP